MGPRDKPEGDSGGWGGLCDHDERYANVVACSPPRPSLPLRRAGREVAALRADHAEALAARRLHHPPALHRSEEHTSELQSLMRISYAVFCLKKKNKTDETKKNAKSQARHKTKTYR